MPCCAAGIGVSWFRLRARRGWTLTGGVRSSAENIEKTNDTNYSMLP